MTQKKDNLEIENLVYMSRRAGGRFDLVQAGGGNSSVKINKEELFVKASGFLLSDVNLHSGYARLDLKKVQSILDDQELNSCDNQEKRESLASALLKKCTLPEQPRPSIETYLHALLDTYTLHTHPLSVTVAVSRADWFEYLINFYPEALFVPYRTPGIELALAFKSELNKTKKKPEIVFLQNHGLLVSVADHKLAYKLTVEISHFLAQKQGFRDQEYRNCDVLIDTLEQVGIKNKIVYLSQDQELIEALGNLTDRLEVKPYFPDAMVFFGYATLSLETMQDESKILEFVNLYSHYPRVILCDGRVYIVAKNVRKAREIEEVFKLHQMGIKLSGQILPKHLSDSELDYLFNWEAEKFRQSL